jgi:hypothetical protein
MWIFFISHKNQVLSKFQHFVHLVETSTGKKVQALRKDNGGEFTSKAFSEFCASKGISRELPPPHTPECNGVAERRNRSLLDITRCLLIDKQLPGYLWGEAVKAAGDILNLRSTKKHPDRTPEELFTGKKPSISHLKIFSSPAFGPLPTFLRLIGRSLLRAPNNAFFWVLMQLQKPTDVTYRPSTRKVFISRDIFVDEAAPPQACEQANPKEKPLVDNTPAPTKREELRTFSDQHLQPPPPTSTDGSGSPHRSPTTTSPQFASTPTISLPADTAHEQLTVESAEPAPSPTLSKPPTIDPPRRSNKIRRFPRHLHDYAAHVQLQTPDLIPEDFTDNITFKQAQLNPN